MIKNCQKIISFTAAFLLHFLLFVVLFWSVKKSDNKVPQATITVEIINEKSQQRQKKSLLDSRVKKLAAAQEQQIIYHDHHQHSSAEYEATKPQVVFNPLPQIPDDLRYEAFNSEAVARFYVAASGVVEKVELVKPCANPKLNHLLLKSLKSWKFATSTSPSTQEIRVNFLVK